jgi:hypothetical protein
MFRARIAAVVTVALMTLGLVATVAGASVPTKTVPPKKWAQGACLALARFFVSVEAHAFAASQSSSQYELEIKLSSALDNSVDAAKNVRRVVKRIGTPDVPKGRQTVAVFDREFKKIAKVLEEASGIVFVADINPGQFDEIVRDAQASVTEALQKGLAAIAAKTDPKVNQELEAAAACQTFRSD